MAKKELELGPCIIADCEGKAKWKGLCGSCYHGAKQAIENNAVGGWDELAEMGLCVVEEKPFAKALKAAREKIEAGGKAILPINTAEAKGSKDGRSGATGGGCRLPPFLTHTNEDNAKASETQQSITEWCEATFGPIISNVRVAARANEEMAELIRALATDNGHPKAAEEIADVFIVLYRLATRLGVDLHAEIDRKMAVNRAREWKLDGTGHGYHVKK